MVYNMISIEIKDWQQKLYDEYKHNNITIKKDLRRGCRKTWILVHIAMIEITKEKTVFIKSTNCNMRHYFIERLIKKLKDYNIPYNNSQIITKLPLGMRHWIDVFIYDEIDYNQKDLRFTTNTNPKIISLKAGRE